MAVWTVSAEVGTGAERIAARLAEAAGAELLDRPALLRLAHDLHVDLGGIDDVDELEARAGGRLNLLAASMAVLAGSAEALCALQQQRSLRDLVQVVATAAAAPPGGGPPPVRDPGPGGVRGAAAPPHRRACAAARAGRLAGGGVPARAP